MQNKYITSFTSGIRQQISEKSQLLGRVFLYLVIVYLFSQVFNQAPSFQLWYSAMTQVITLSASMVAFEIAEDIQSGQIAHFIIRPIHYVGYRLCQGMGVSLVRYLILIPCYLVIRFYGTQALPKNFVLGILFGIMSIFLFTLTSILIGLLSFWMREIRSIFYLNLTAAFCFGGLIVPLEFYSPFVKAISFATPYPWILWWSSKWMAGLPVNLLSAILSWSFWIIFLGLLIVLVYNKCIKSFVMEGG